MKTHNAKKNFQKNLRPRTVGNIRKFDGGGFLCPRLLAPGVDLAQCALQPPSERQYEKNDQDDSSDSDSTVRAVRVVAAATAEQ
jgi:hypothetical protein